MSVNLALNSALSGLLTSQQALSVVSNNLANVNNPDYSKKTVNLQERVLSGVGAGVEISTISRAVDEGLNSTIRTVNGTQSQLQTNDNFYTQLQNLFGQPGDTGSFAHRLQDLASAFDALAVNPNSSPAAAVQAATTVTTNLQSLTTNIQSLRQKADAQIGAAVVQVNASLTNINSLNEKISVLAAAGISTDDLKDQRDKELNTLSNYMDYTSFTRSDETVSLFTKTGTPLLDGTALPVAHSASTIIQPWMTQSSGNLAGITANGIDISNQISSGSLAALINLRDGILPNLQSQIDTLSQTLQQQINQINNQGVSFPSGGQSMTGTKTFSSPDTQKMSLTGGDTAVVLLAGDGSEQARTTVNTLMQSYLGSIGVPSTSSWTSTQLASAMNGWLNTQFKTSGITYSSVNSAGQFSVQLPQTSSTTIAFRDQHTTSFDSSLASGANTPLGVNGPLTFNDTQGNAYTVNVVASDTLSTIQNNLNSLGGLTASLVANGSNFTLKVANNAGLDMTVAPDGAGTNVVTQLGLMPSRSEAAADVTVNYNGDQQGTTFTSLSYPSSASAANAGISGQLVFRDTNGTVGSVTVTAGMGLTAIANAINAGGAGRLNATVVSTGNQVAIQVSDTAGYPLSIDGTPQTYQSAPAAAFVASAGKTLSVTVGSTTYGPLTETGADTLQTIANSINATGGTFSGSGLLASVQTNGTNSWLNITSTNGQPPSFSGTMVGQLGLTLNAKDSLGLAATPESQVKGFSNFLGLNDFFVTNQPKTTVESQTLTSFVSPTASSINLSDASWSNGDPATGSPQSLSINIPNGMSLASIAAKLNAAAVTYDISKTALGTFSAQTGTLTLSTGNTTLGSVTLNSGDSLSTVAQNINSNAGLDAQGVRAIVATDGTSEWLRIYDQQGQALLMSGSAIGTNAGQLSFSKNQMARAAVISDGAGQRLRITNNNNSDLIASGSLMTQTGMSAAAVNTANTLTVRADIQNNPSLVSRGTVLFNADTNKYYVTTGDNTTILNMAMALQNKQTIPSSGGIGITNSNLSDYAANIIGTNSINGANNKTQLTYQSNLQANLGLQKSNISGVNMDQEVSNLIAYQQAYSASAKVISTMQTLFDVLDSIIK